MVGKLELSVKSMMGVDNVVLMYLAKLDFPLCFVFGRSHWMHVTSSTEIGISSEIHQTANTTALFADITGCHG